jgi:FkbM family methyltransferase
MHPRAVRLLKNALPTPLYQKFKIAYQTRFFAKHVAEHDFGNFRFKLSIEDPVAEGWYTYDWPVPKEVTVLQEHGVTVGSRVFDLGAHQGLMAMMFSHVVGERGVVVAVEAGRHNAAVCRRNLVLNGITNVEAVWAVVTQSAGKAAFADSYCGAMTLKTGWLKSNVAAVTIDGLASRYGAPDAVLIDVEGAEMLALRGAKRTIARGTLFVVEVHAGCGLEEMGAEVADVLKAFPGYRFLISPGDEHVGWEAPDGAIAGRTFLLACPPLHGAET